MRLARKYSHLYAPFSYNLTLHWIYTATDLLFERNVLDVRFSYIVPILCDNIELIVLILRI